MDSAGVWSITSDSIARPFYNIESGLSMKTMPAGNKNPIDAVLMDTWDPFIKAVKKKLPNAKIVFDLFHVVANFNRVIDKVGNSDYRKPVKTDSSHCLPRCRNTEEYKALKLERVRRRSKLEPA